ncbi:MAG: phosphoglycerate mutase [Pseudomonadota bacterium]|nr:phosphoglycerate mutase [Pseudomonadota bacterium]
MATATLLLGERSRFGGQRLSEATGAALARADLVEDQSTQLRRAFDVLPRGWPVAAVTRQRDVGDAGGAVWLRADPAYIRPDLGGARLMAYGEALGLSTPDVEAFLPPLRPLFGDFGFLIDAPVPSRWYLQLPAGARVPVFAEPEDALGADLIDQIPGSEPDIARASADSRRWRSLLSESQVLLHNHPRNAERIEAGLAPVNSLWFWGAGVLPDHVRSEHDELLSEDESLAAFALLAGVAAAPLPSRWNEPAGNCLVDLRHARDLAQLQSDWLQPMLDALAARRLDRAVVDFADGARYVVTRSQKWRFWRRPMRSLAK